MAEPRHLPNAPITEALIDLRVNKSDATALEQSLDMLKNRLGDRFPVTQARRGFEADFVFQLGRGARQHTKDTGFDGFFFSSQDGLNVVQLRPDGFTYNRLKPYTSWDEIYPQALELWRLYVEVAKPEFVVRTALRYINHLKIPLPIANFGDYLTTLPNAPLGASYYINGFLTRVIIGDPSLGTEAAVSQALEPGADPKSVIIILDLDVFKEKEFDPLGDELLAVLGNLRAMKNNIFFGSITEETLRSIDGS